MSEDEPFFHDQEEEELFSMAKMGEEARLFFATPAGRYVLGAAKQEIKEAQESLLTVAPWRTKRIKSLQNQAVACKLAIKWLQEVIAQGENAHEQLILSKAES